MIIGCASKKEILTEGDVKEIVPDEQSEKKYYNHENAFYPLQQTMEEIQYQVNDLRARVEEYESTLHAPTLNAELLKLIKTPQVEHELLMTNGTIIQGKIINETSDQLIIQTRIGQLKLSKEYIESIKNIEPLAPLIVFNEKNIEEKISKTSLSLSGTVTNEGGRRGDFIRVIYKLWETDTAFLFADSTFISGNTIQYSNNVISDACLNPGETGTFKLKVEIPDTITVTYWTKEIKFDIFE